MSILLWSFWLFMPEVPIWHHNMIWGILWWPPSSLPCQIYWLSAAHQGLNTYLWVSPGQPWGTLCPYPLLLSPNLRCISTYEGIGRQLTSGPLASLAFLALGRQWCQLLMSAAIVTAMTTLLVESLSLPQLSVLKNLSCLLIVMNISLSWANAVLLDERSLFCINLPSSLCGLQNTVFHLIYGSNKLEHYMHCPRS